MMVLLFSAELLCLNTVIMHLAKSCYYTHLFAVLVNHLPYHSLVHVKFDKCQIAVVASRRESSW